MWKTIEKVGKKLAFPSSLLRREVKDVKMGKKKCFYNVRGVMGCQTVRRGDRKMKSQGEGRGEDVRVKLSSDFFFLFYYSGSYG